MAGARVLAIIVNYNGGTLVEDAVRSLVEQRERTDVLVVDNASADGSDRRIAERFPDVVVEQTGANLGFVAANAALQRSGYDFYFFFNPDAVALPSTVQELVAIMDRHPKLAALSATLVDYRDPNVIQTFAPKLDLFAFPLDLRYDDKPVSALPDADYVEAAYAMGAAALFRAEPFRRIGGFDSTFFMFTEEVDACWRLRLLGWKIGAAPRVRVRHVGGAIAGAGKSEGGGYTTSLQRVYLRERNCFAMCLKCYSLPVVVPYAILNVLALGLEIAVLRLLGRSEMATPYVRALADVWRRRDDILRGRRAVQQTRVVGDRVLLPTRFFGYAKLAKLLRQGLPNIKDFARRPDVG